MHFKNKKKKKKKERAKITQLTFSHNQQFLTILEMVVHEHWMKSYLEN